MAGSAFIKIWNFHITSLCNYPSPLTHNYQIYKINIYYTNIFKFNKLTLPAIQQEPLHTGTITTIQ